MVRPRRPADAGSPDFDARNTVCGTALVAALILLSACGRDTTPTSPAAASPPSHQPAIVAPPPEEARAQVVYQSKGNRDPFRQPRPQTARKEPVVNLKVTGIVWGPRSYYALIESGSSPEKGYVIRENDLIESARVVKITKDRVIFEIRTTSARGKPLTRYVQKQLGS